MRLSSFAHYGLATLMITYRLLMPTGRVMTGYFCSIHLFRPYILYVSFGNCRFLEGLVSEFAIQIGNSETLAANFVKETNLKRVINLANWLSILVKFLSC